MQDAANSASPLTVLYAFGQNPDPSFPIAVTYRDGIFYGTTWGGGESGIYGTAFSVLPSGKLTVLHSFLYNDGAYPEAGLTYWNGQFFGTTQQGGSSANAGTFFSVTATGQFATLYTFSKKGDGGWPSGNLVFYDGRFYGTTYYGGTYGLGVVYSMTPNGKENVIHSFGSGSDGSQPFAGLVRLGDALYGTTLRGGAGGLGILFRITPKGKYTVLHRFTGSPDGNFPWSRSLTTLGNAIYGTTKYGGTEDYGVVFSCTGAGKYAIIYNFTKSVGRYPLGVTAIRGRLYGGTDRGRFYPWTGGAIYSMTTSGQLKSLYELDLRNPQGYDPDSFLDAKNLIYGVNTEGVRSNTGTLFSIKP